MGIDSTNASVAAEDCDLCKAKDKNQNHALSNLVTDGEDSSKWVTSKTHDLTWVTVNFAEEHNVSSIGFKSANDSIARDPERVEILAWNEDAGDDQWSSA